MSVCPGTSTQTTATFRPRKKSDGPSAAGQRADRRVEIGVSRCWAGRRYRGCSGLSRISFTSRSRDGKEAEAAATSGGNSREISSRESDPAGARAGGTAAKGPARERTASNACSFSSLTCPPRPPERHHRSSSASIPRISREGSRSDAMHRELLLVSTANSGVSSASLAPLLRRSRARGLEPPHLSVPGARGRLPGGGPADEPPPPPPPGSCGTPARPPSRALPLVVFASAAGPRSARRPQEAPLLLASDARPFSTSAARCRLPRTGPCHRGLGGARRGPLLEGGPGRRSSRFFRPPLVHRPASGLLSPSPGPIGTTQQCTGFVERPPASRRRVVGGKGVRFVVCCLFFVVCCFHERTVF